MQTRSGRNLETESNPEDAPSVTEVRPRRRMTRRRSNSPSHGSDEENFNSKDTEALLSRNRKDSKPNSEIGEEAGCTNPSLWKKDGKAISILMFLYVLQGIPLGLCGSIPYILTNRGISYEKQALFSFTFWPFSLKLLWAPFVDAVYNKKFGRRKSWLIPVQYFLGAMMIWLSFRVDDLVQGDIWTLTALFFLLNFGAATQDIAVDGWCLTMLSKENVGWASTCNSVGQTAGYFLGNVVFLALESVDFSNNWVRPILGLAEVDHGLVTLPRFMYFWGIVFVIATTLVGIFKTEKGIGEEDMGVVETYLVLKNVMKKKLVLMYIAFAMTSRVGLSASDSVTGLKLIEKGVPRENLALMAVPLTPIQIILPLLISKYTAGPRPMNVWLRAYLPRLFFGYLMCYIVYLASTIGVSSPDREVGLDYPNWYYMFLIVSSLLHQVLIYCNFVSIMAFHAKVSDPEIGGTYMTLMNTVSNLGGNWCQTAALFFVDKLSTFDCQVKSGNNNSNLNSTVLDWDLKSLKPDCESAGGNFVTTYDGYYLEVIVTTTLGFVWLWWIRKHVYYMDSKPANEWHVKKLKKGDSMDYVRLENNN